MRQLARLLTRFVLAVLLLLTLIWVAIQLPPVQTIIVNALTGRIHTLTGFDVKIGGVDIRYPIEIALRDVIVIDHRDTVMFESEALLLRSLEIDLKKQVYHAYRVELVRPEFKLMVHEGDTLSNLNWLLEQLPDSETSDDSSSVAIGIDEVRVQRGQFIYMDYNLPVSIADADFDHVRISGLNTHIRNIRINDADLDAEIRNLAFNEISGFELQRLQGHFAMRSDTLRLDNYLLKTPGTLLTGNLLFAFEHWSDFSAFTERITMRGLLIDSKVDFNDLALFAPELKGINRSVNVSGAFRGPVANLKVRQLHIGFAERTYLKGRIDMIGLPDIERTFIDLTINELSTIRSELEDIPLPPFSDGKKLKTPDNLRKLGKVSFNGKFTGFFNDFVAFGKLSTEIGNISTDIKFQEQGNTFAYSGALNTDRFDLAKFYSSPDLGPLTSQLRIQGSGLTRDDLDVTFEGRIKSLRLLNYPYRDITAAGEFKQNFFNGNLNIADENVQLDFVGLIDFTLEKPDFDFTTSITHLNPVALNLVSLNDYMSVSGDFRINANGLNVNDINGEVIGDSVRFCTAVAEYPIEHLELFMQQDEVSGKQFTLASDVASGKLEGKFDFTGLGSGFKQIMADVIPNVAPPPAHRRGREDFYLELMVHNFELVSEVFLPELQIAPKSRLSLLMDDSTGDFKTTFTSDRVSYNSVAVDSLLIDMSHPDESLYLTFQSANADFGIGLQFPNIALDAYNSADTVYANVVWGNEGDVLRGDFATTTTIRGNQNLTSELESLNLFFNEERWQLQHHALISVDSTRYAVDELLLARGGEYIRMAGAVSPDPDEFLSLDLKGLQLSIANPFLIEQGIEQEALISGNLQLRDVYHTLLITCDVLALDYTLNGYLVGDVCAESSWDPRAKRLMVAGEVERSKEKQVLFSGFYTPDNEESPLDLLCELNALPLELANAFIDEDVAEVFGSVNGKIQITGPLDQPEIEGNLFLNNASARVAYLNTTYFINNRVSLFPDMIAFNFPIRDEDYNEGYIVGTVLHDNFSEWNFDLFLDLERSPFLLLNTTRELNNLYFGKAYATGFINISGTADDLSINVTARSERGTNIALPLGGAEEISFEDFISFVSVDAVEAEEPPIDLSGITLNFELDITPDAQFRIIFDEVVGDEIRGRGRGNIRMEINNLSTFNMYGNIAVEQGRYLFTLKNLINKEFEVRPGGTITWFGDPLAADINLTAIYKVNTALYELFPDESEQYKQRVPVNLNLLLSGKLMSPQVSFDILLPNSDELTRARVASAINNEQEINRQAFALLVLRRFISPPDIAKSNTSLGLAENSTELITSQLSNWLSQISDDFDIGVNYSPGDQLSNEEIAVALSTQLFNDRLLVSGSFGVQQAQASNVNDNPNNLIGDIRIEYKVHPSGKIRLIVYNQSNEFDLVRSRQNAYTQGFGVVYQQDFNSIYELFGLTIPN
jgi:hypothetical protein